MARTIETVAVKMVLDATGVTDSIGATTKEITEAGRILNSLKTPLEKLEEKEARLQDLFLKGAVDDIPKYQRALNSIRQQKDDLAAASAKEEEAQRKAIQAQEAAEQKLKDMAIAAEKEAAAKREEAKAQEIANQKMKDMSEAGRIMNSLRTPLQRLNDEEKRLLDLFAKGAVDDIPRYERALEELRRQKNHLTAATDKQTTADKDYTNSQQMVIQKLSILGDLVKYHVIARGVTMVRDAFHEVVSGVTNAGKRLDEIGDSAAKLGISASALQSLRLQADLSDVSFESLTGGMEKLMIKSSDAAMGNKELQKTFGLLGISVGELQTMTDAERFNRVTQALAGMTDRATKLNIISDLFGRGNTEMIMFIDNLDKASAAADGTNAVVTDEQIARIGEADEAVKMMMHSLDGVYNVAAAELAPAVTDIATAVAEFLAQDVNDSDLLTGLINLSAILSQMPEEAKGWSEWLKGGLESLFANTQVGEDIAAFGRESEAFANAQQQIRRQQQFNANKERLNQAGVDTVGMNFDATRDAIQELERREQAERRLAEAERIASEQREEAFDKEKQSLEDQLSASRMSAEAIQQQKDARAGFTAEQQDYLAGLRDEKAAIDALKFAEDEDLKAKKDRMSQAEAIRQSLQSAEDAAVGRLERAMDLATLGEAGGLTQDEFDRLLEKEARGLMKSGGQDFKLSASAFGSQAAIAATLGRDQQNDSQRLESIKQSLLELVKKPSVEVAEVGAI